MNRDNNAVNDDVLFDDWATRDPAIYARHKRVYAFSFVLIGVSFLSALSPLSSLFIFLSSRAYSL